MQVIQVLLGVFKFWDEVTKLVTVLQGTPEDHREKIMAGIQAESDALAKTGRPTWG